MTLPIDRTQLALALSNQNPSNTFNSSPNKNSLSVAYNTIDELYAFTTGLISAGTLSRLGTINVKDYNASGSANTFTGSITTGTKVLTLTTVLHDFVVGQGIAIVGAGVAGATLITSVSSLSNMTVTLADNASTTVASATVAHDDTVAIEAAKIACVANGGGEVRFPSGKYFISTEHAMASNVRYVGSGQRATYLYLNTGAVGIRIAGTTHASFRDMSVVSLPTFSNPSVVGIVQQRSALLNANQWGLFENVTIDMLTDSTANDNLGTVGLYNCTSELVNYRNLTVYADVPVIISRGNLYDLANDTGTESMKCVAFSGVTTLIASKGHALILEGGSDITFENLYLTKNLFREFASNTEQYAILVTGTAAYGYENYGIQMLNVDIEEFESTMRVDAKLRDSLIQGNHANGVNGSHLISCNSSQGQMINVEVKLFHTGATTGTLDLVKFNTGCLNPSKCIFHMTSGIMQITTDVIMTACIIHSTKLNCLVTTHSSNQQVMITSDQGYGFNNRTMTWGNSLPTVGVEAQGSIMWNQAHNATRGRPAGWATIGSIYLPFGQVGYRSNAGSPSGVLTPDRVGEWVLDTTNKVIYDAVGTANTDWKSRH